LSTVDTQVAFKYDTAEAERRIRGEARP
jgi:hypothetical protein